MITKKILTVSFLIIFALFLNGCAKNSKFNKPFKHNTPLIKKDIKSVGKAEVLKTLEMGPKPVDGDPVKLKKRKKITSESQRNYLLIPEEYKLLKQRITLKFKNLDFKETRKLMGKIGVICLPSVYSNSRYKRKQYRGEIFRKKKYRSAKSFDIFIIINKQGTTLTTRKVLGFVKTLGSKSAK